MQIVKDFGAILSQDIFNIRPIAYINNLLRYPRRKTSRKVQEIIKIFKDILQEKLGLFRSVRAV
jgi:hypothetical protein